jgi:5-methylcytosine-specific restriction endonuclease McrA
MTYFTAQKRYKSIKDRAFKSFFELYLIKCYLVNNSLNNVNIDDFKNFHYNNPEISKCLKAFQLPSDNSDFTGHPVKELDKAIKAWEAMNSKAEYKEYFNLSRIIQWEEFKELYGEDDNEYRICGYCKTKEKDLQLLIEKGEIQTKRLATRGRNLEVDRYHPNEGYTEENIVLACYWCNNAKTDEFEGKEFMPVAESIGKIFEARLSDLDRGIK